MKIPYKINQIDRVIAEFNKGFNRKFKCNICDSEYASPQSRRRHEKAVHLHNDVIYKCTICNNGYLYKDSLNRHMKTHK